MNKIMLALLLLVACFAKAETVQLGTLNTVVFRGEVTTESVAKAEYRLLDLISKRGTKTYSIYLVLDSPGGDIGAGNDFIEFAKTFPNVKTVSIFAASMASSIVEHLPGERLVTEKGVLMFHRARGGVQGQFEDGELESRLAFFKALVRGMEQKSANRIGISLSSYKEKVKDEWWTMGNDAVAQHTADKVVDLTCSSGLIAQKDLTQVNMVFFVIDVEFSGCPLLRAGKVIKPKEGESNEN